MSLKIQLISIFFSGLYGILLSLLITLNYTFLFESRKTIKIIGNILFSLDMALLYFISMKKINNAMIHPIFYLLIFLGYILTYRKIQRIVNLQNLEKKSIIISGKVGDIMAKNKKKKKIGPFFLCVFSLAMIVFTTYTVGKYWVSIYSKYKEKKELTKELASLKDKEDELKADVLKLQDADYVARYAREKYYYSKDGEYILRIPEEE